jgi:hypothetical protein
MNPSGVVPMVTGPARHDVPNGGYLRWHLRPVSRRLAGAGGLRYVPGGSAVRDGAGAPVRGKRRNSLFRSVIWGALLLPRTMQAGYWAVVDCWFPAGRVRMAAGSACQSHATWMDP